MRVGIIGVVTLGAICPVQAAQPAKGGSADFAAARAAVADELRDPAAAQFRNVRKSRTGGPGQICGEVNGKNAFGGYVGFKPFIYLVKSKTAVIQPDDDTWQSLDPDTRKTIFDAFSDC